MKNFIWQEIVVGDNSEGNKKYDGVFLCDGRFDIIDSAILCDDRDLSYWLFVEEDAYQFL